MVVGVGVEFFFVLNIGVGWGRSKVWRMLGKIFLVVGFVVGGVGLWGGGCFLVLIGRICWVVWVCGWCLLFLVFFLFEEFCVSVVVVWLMLGWGCVIGRV